MTQVHPPSDEEQLQKHQVSCSSYSMDSWLPLQHFSSPRNCLMSPKMLADNSFPPCCLGCQHLKAFGLNCLQKVSKYIHILMITDHRLIQSKPKHHTILKSRIVPCYGSLIRCSSRLDTSFPFQIQPSSFLLFYLLSKVRISMQEI